MLTLEKLRQIDPELKDMSDGDLEELRSALYEMGQLAFDIWLDRKNGSKNPVGSFPIEHVVATL